MLRLSTTNYADKRIDLSVYLSFKVQSIYSTMYYLSIIQQIHSTTRLIKFV